MTPEERADAVFDVHRTISKQDVPLLDLWQFVVDHINAAIAEERENCAKVAEGFERNRNWVPGSLYETLRKEVANAIRNRK